MPSFDPAITKRSKTATPGRRISNLLQDIERGRVSQVQDLLPITPRSLAVSQYASRLAPNADPHTASALRAALGATQTTSAPQGSTGGGVLSDQQIARLAYDAGFRGEALATIVATSLGESSGNYQAVGDVSLQDGKWGPSVGLFQVRTLKDGSDPYRNKELLLQDPLAQARAAYAISGGGKSFQPWTVYTSGAYRKYLDRARAASAGLF